jgi:hypothetical protein
MRLPVITVLAVCTCAAPGWADTLVLRSGARQTGRFLSGTATEITFQNESGSRQNYDIRDVQSIQFENLRSGIEPGSGAGAAGSTANADSEQAGRVLRRGDSSAGTASAGQDGTRPATSTGVTPNATQTDGRTSAPAAARQIPAGTDLVVRTNEAIEANSATEGRTYPAQVERAIVDTQGNTLVPQGSKVELVVQRVDEGGQVGSGQLVLDVQSIEIGGRRYLVSTTDVQQSDERGIGANRRTATMVGGGAVLGSLLGAIAGGGKGAAIGAIAGAAAGAGAQVLTRGDQIKVPAETVLTFRLDKPVSLVPASQ